MVQPSDSELLRRFEPVLHFTKGENFFPMDVEAYISCASLWVQRPGQEPVCLIPQGELTLEKLAEPRAHGFGSVTFLKFIEPLNIASYAAYRLEEVRRLISKKNGDSIFRGRLSRVGYFPRLLDALFSLTLLARGRVPGDTAAAAVLEYKRIQQEQECYRYYGRVLRDNGWIILQYWFFYTFNDWRSGYGGVNDHEVDWESINLFLSESQQGDIQPEWASYAAHTWSGDDMRRRWDDPELKKVGEHPVVFAGAGSHASYFSPGEYLTEVELPLLSPLGRFLDRSREAWRKLLGQNSRAVTGSTLGVFRIPFVDYARGDGLTIGPGQHKEWDEPGLLTPTPPWVQYYRGLWGLYARDPISGENAPGGPMYDQNGKVRRLWHNPLGWAGLDKVPTLNNTLTQAEEQRNAICARCTQLAGEIERISHELTALGIEAAAMRNLNHMKQRYAVQQESIRQKSRELDEMREQLVSDEALLNALDLYIKRVQAGKREPPRAHLYRPRRPTVRASLRLNPLAELWAALSIGLTMIGIVALALFAREHLLVGLVTIFTLFIFIETGFRRQLSQLINSASVGLAGAAALVLLYEFFWTFAVVGTLIAGGYLMWENLRELPRDLWRRKKNN
ncbi:MAG: flagellar FliJ family protein [Anaerolineales bacterium]|nr:flagellar FliJ family protein [Anaerolineales bacterium]